MKIKKITWQHRFDFAAILECEHCSHEQNIDSGYNDENYHNNVMPTITCESCKKDRSGGVPKIQSPTGMMSATACQDGGYED